MRLFSYFRSAFADSGKKRAFYTAYSIIFCVVAFFCFVWFIAQGKSLIWNDDGWKQHLKALVYYSEYLRTIISHLLHEHALIIPEWDFCIGEGSDILGTFHYYVIGDPIAFLSVFVPTRYMHVFYSFSCILRLYLAGLAFSAFCFGTGKRSRYGIMAGSIAYCFCGWALMNAARHLFFLNPMIWFPLLILGIEKIIRKESPRLFIAAAAVSAASNFYFFYMIAILGILYALFRLGTLYRKSFIEGIRTLLYLGAMAVVGVCIAGIIFLPVLAVFLQDSRISVSQPFHWFYPLSYYRQLPSEFITVRWSYWLLLGYSAPVTLAIFLLFIRKKEDGLLKAFFLSGLLFILFPIGGRILNGMSYMANRWSWAYAFLCMYILVKKWDDLLSLSQREWKLLSLCCALYFTLCMFLEKTHSVGMLVAMAAIFVSLIIAAEDHDWKKWKLLSLCCVLYFSVCMFLEKPKDSGLFIAMVILFAALFVVRRDSFWMSRPALRQTVLLLLVALGIVNLAFSKYSPYGEYYAAESMDNREVWEKWDNSESVTVKSVSEFPFTRFTGRSLTWNANVSNRISSTQYYWTLSNPYMNEYRTDLWMRESLYSMYQGYDDRTTPITLSAVQYYVTNIGATEGLPYGFSAITNTGSDSPIIYKNEYALPIAYCYDAWVSADVWDSCDPVQKQELQLEAAYINANPETIGVAIEPVRPEPADYSVPFELTCSGDKITRTENGFVTTAKDAKVTLTLLTENMNSETYVAFEGLEFTPPAQYTLHFGTENVDIDVASANGIRKTLKYYQPDANFSSGRHDFIVNLGYAKSPAKKITITLSACGAYTFDSLRVYSVPMDGYTEKIEKLRENKLENIEFGTNSVMGEITVDDARILCLATPYSKGWEARIDGNETEVFCLNGRYLGITIPEGSHVVQFHYKTPYACEGLELSLFGCAVFAVILALDRRKCRVSHS